MPLPKSIADRFYRAFQDDNSDGTPILRVANKDGTVISAGGGGGTSMVDDAAFTVGTSSL